MIGHIQHLFGDYAAIASLTIEMKIPVWISLVYKNDNFSFQKFKQEIPTYFFQSKIL